jgi:integrase
MRKPRIKQRNNALHFAGKVKGVEISLSLGLKLGENMHFDGDKVLALKREPELVKQVNQINSQLDFFNLCFAETYDELKNDGITNFKFKELLKDKYINKATKGDATKNLKAYVDEYIEGIKTGFILSSKHKPYDKDSVRAKKTSLEIIKTFLNSRVPKDLDRHTGEEFIKYLTLNTTSSTNTVRKHIKELKVFGKWLYNKEVIKYDFSRDWKKPAEPETTHVYLNDSELDKIKNKFMPADVDRFRTLFLVQCYTGLRVSDLLNLKREHIRNKRIIMTQKKTESPVIIPLADKVWFHLERWFSILETDFKVHEQEYNVNIKHICELAGINSPVELVKETLKGETKKSVPKFKAITSHTARRTAITNLYLKDCPKAVLMTISGHKSESSLMKYIKASGIEIIDKMDIPD